MNRAIPDACEWGVRHVGYRWVPCGRSAVYDHVGEQVRVLVYDLKTNKYIGSECWLKADPVGESVFRQGQMQFPGFPNGYSQHEPDKDEERLLSDSQRQFRWTLTDVPERKSGGLVREDNSGVI